MGYSWLEQSPTFSAAVVDARPKMRTVWRNGRYCIDTYNITLVGGIPTPLKNISQWEGLSHILWKIKHVWNHQPEYYIYVYTYCYQEYSWVRLCRPSQKSDTTQKNNQDASNWCLLLFSRCRLFARNNVQTIQSNLTILNPQVLDTFQSSPPKHHPIATSRWSAMAQITIEGFWMRGWIRGWGGSCGWCKKSMG